MKVSGFVFGFGLVALLAVPSKALVRGSPSGGKRIGSTHQRQLKMDDSEEDDDTTDDGGIVLPPLPPIDEIVDAIPCFSNEVKVKVQHKEEPVDMEDLHVGDKVLTGSGSYEPIYAFGHYNPEEYGKFLQFITADASAAALEMTGDHLVFLHNHPNPVRADSIQVGDVLNGEGGSPLAVKEIHFVIRPGLYAPLTAEGTIVASGIVVSTYISLQEDAAEFIQMEGTNLPMSQHTFVHWVLSPFRMVCMGISADICQSYSYKGIPHYIEYGIQFIDWAQTQNIVVQVVFLALGLSIAGLCMFVEYIFGAAYAPLAVIGLGLSCAAMVSMRLVSKTSKVKTV